MSRYVPILKAMQGEFQALATIPDVVWESITPFLDIPPRKWDHEVGEYKESTDTQFRRVGRRLRKSIGYQRRFFCDAYYAESGEHMQNGTHPLLWLSRCDCLFRPSLIPVTGLDRPEQHDEAVRDVNTESGSGVCVRLEEQDLIEHDVLQDRVDDLLTRVNCQPRDADILVDYRSVDAEKVEPLADQFVHYCARFNRPSYRSLILANGYLRLQISRISTQNGLADRGQSEASCDSKAMSPKSDEDEA